MSIVKRSKRTRGPVFGTLVGTEERENVGYRVSIFVEDSRKGGVTCVISVSGR